MGEYKIVKCQHYGPTAGAGTAWFEIHELNRFLWFPRWKPIKERTIAGLYAYFSPVRFRTIEEAEERIERLQVNKPNTTVREDVPLD